MKRDLDARGPGSVIGPVRVEEGVRLIGFCGRERIKPPKPPREVLRTIILNEKYQRASSQLMRDLRRKAFIDEKGRL